MWRRILAVFYARNQEFLRDRAAMVWALFFPFMMLIGFKYIFQNDQQAKHKVAYVGTLSPDIQNIKTLDFVLYQEVAQGLDNVSHHKVDLLIDFQTRSYWVNAQSTKGYVVEKMLQNELAGFVKNQVDAQAISYAAWLFPGLVGMNIMFACLWGVGWVIVNHRKKGILRRLKGTPLKAWEYLTAQVASRMMLNILITILLFAGGRMLVDLPMRGSWILLMGTYVLGIASLISVGLVVASFFSSEEFASGLINLLSWPMMILSEVWFSLEGAPEWLRNVAKFFPLSHIVQASRGIMVDGMGWEQLWPHWLVLGGLAVVLTTVSALVFRWEKV